MPSTISLSCGNTRRSRRLKTRAKPVLLEDALRAVKHVKFEGNICILASLTIRDVLRRLGFAADVKSVALQVRAWLDDIPLHTLGVGLNALWDEPYRGKDWDGHLIVTLPGFIVDPTFYCMRRDSWNWTPDVAIVSKKNAKGNGIEATRRILPAIAAWHREMPNPHYRFEAVWAATGNKGWLKAPDTKPERRHDLTEEILTGIRSFVERE